MTDAAKKTDAPASPSSPSKKLEQQLKEENPNWSAWYVEGHDQFAEFESFDPNLSGGGGAGGEGMGAASSSVGGGGSERHLSARQISGMLEGQKAADDRWAEDWNDEDAEDTFDRVAEKCGLAHGGGDKELQSN